MPINKTIEQRFNERFGKLFEEEQLKKIEKQNKEGANWKPYPRNESIKQFFQKEIDEVLEEIEKQRIPPNTLVAVTIWNRCIDKAKQIINKRFKG